MKEESLEEKILSDTIFELQGMCVSGDIEWDTCLLAMQRLKEKIIKDTDLSTSQTNMNLKPEINIIRHSIEMITEEYVYKTDFRFQRTMPHGIWFVTYENHLITFGQYRHDLEQWVDANYFIKTNNLD